MFLQMQSCHADGAIVAQNQFLQRAPAITHHRNQAFVGNRINKAAVRIRIANVENSKLISINIFLHNDVETDIPRGCLSPGWYRRRWQPRCWGRARAQARRSRPPYAVALLDPRPAGLGLSAPSSARAEPVSSLGLGSLRRLKRG